MLRSDSPDLYVSRDCTYFWETVPYLARDEKCVEDLDSTGLGNGAAACPCRNGILRMRSAVNLVRVVAH